MKHLTFLCAVVLLLCLSGCTRHVQIKWEEPSSGASVRVYTLSASQTRGAMTASATLPATFRLTPGRRYQVVMDLKEGFLDEIGYQNPDNPKPVLYGFLDVGPLTENATLAKVPVILIPEIEDLNVKIQGEKDLQAKQQLLNDRAKALKESMFATAIKKGIIIKSQTTGETRQMYGQAMTPTLINLKLGDQDPDRRY